MGCCCKGHLRVGDVLEGFCGGAFGRDSYDSKTVIALDLEEKFVVVREWGGLNFYAGDPDDLLEYKRKECEDDE